MAEDSLLTKEESVTNRSRLKEIVSVFKKYNVIPNFIQQSRPEEVRKAFEELGPTFIKIGQLLSVRPDVITPEYCRELQKLQDDVRTDEFAVVKDTIEKEIGGSISDIFSSFDEEPFASASMGQTHLAVLKNGDKVAVKIQHPNIHDKIKTDLSLFEKALPLIQTMPKSNVVNPKQVLEEIKYSLLNEIDSVKEAANGVEFYENNNNEGIIESPIIYPEYCTEKMLVAEYKEGISMNTFIEVANEKSGKNKQVAEEYLEIREYIGKTIIENFVKQVFEDGFFHADPHPGNIMIHMLEEEVPSKRNGEEYWEGEEKRRSRPKFSNRWKKELPNYRIVYLDFGMMGRVDRVLVEKLTKIVMSIITKNTQEIGNAVLNLCNKTGPLNRDAFFEELEPFLMEYYDMPMGDIDFQVVFNQTVRICHHNNLQVPHDITLLVKSFLTIESVVEELNPSLSMMEIATSFAKRNFQATFDVKDELRQAAFEMVLFSRIAPKIPKKMVDALDTLSKGRAKVNIELKEPEKVLNQVERMVNKLVIGFILSATIIAFSILGASDTIGARAIFSKLSYILLLVGLIGLIVLVVNFFIKRKK